MRAVQVSFLVLISALTAWTQTAPVLRIETSGNDRIKTEEIVRVSGLKVGQQITKPQIHAAAERIMASGQFERVDYRWEPEAGGIVLTFTVREKAAPVEAAPAQTAPRIKAVTFEGNTVIATPRLVAALGDVMHDRLYEAPDVQQTLDNLLRPLYLERAYWGVRFTHSTEPFGGGIRVRVAVDEGEALTLQSVTIDGGDRRWVQSAAFPIGAPAVVKNIQAAVGRVRGNMEREGFLKAGIITQEVVEEGQLKLMLKVDPGPKFTFRTLLIQGLDYDTEVRARKLWTLKAGSPMDPAAVETFIRAVFTARIPRGTNVQREFQIQPGRTEVDVVVRFK